MLVVRGTKKLRDRVKGPVARADEVSSNPAAFDPADFAGDLQAQRPTGFDDGP